MVCLFPNERVAVDKATYDQIRAQATAWFEQGESLTDVLQAVRAAHLDFWARAQKEAESGGGSK